MFGSLAQHIVTRTKKQASTGNAIYVYDAKQHGEQVCWTLIFLLSCCKPVVKDNSGN